MIIFSKGTEQIAKLGYLALGVDMYGDGKTADTPDDAGLLMNAVLKISRSSNLV